MSDSQVSVSVGSSPSSRLFYGCGKHLDHDLNLADLIEKAGLNWEVGSSKIKTISEDAAFDDIQIPSKKAIIRVDNKRPLGVVGKGYVHVQNGEYLENAGVKELLDTNQIYPIRGGSFYMGDSVRVWIVFSMQETFNVGPAEVIRSFLIFNWSHDGLHSLSAVVTNYNETKKTFIPTGKNAISLRHTKNVKSRILQAQQIINRAVSAHELSQKNFSNLVNTIFIEEDMNQYLERLFPKKQTINDNGQVRRSRSDTTKEEIMDIFKGVKDTSYTKWAALSSVVEWVDHCRKPKKSSTGLSMEESKLNSIWFGNGATLKIKAMKELS